MTTSLHEVAPRLAKARDERLKELARETEAARVRDAEAAHKATLRLKADWLVAHRELQLLRAGATGNRKYVQYRHRKLIKARAKRKRLG